MWLDPSNFGLSLVWRHTWPLEIIVDLVSSKNMESKITNSYLELVALVDHKATLLVVVPTARMAAL